MTPELQDVFDKLERQRAHVTALVQNLSEDMYLQAPPGKWSIAQIVTHLITSERLSLGYMRKKSLGIENLKDSGLRQDLLFVVLQLSQRIPFRYKAPRAVVENTPATLSRHDALTQWNESRRALKDFLNGITPGYARRLIFRHPVAGMLNARQAVAFMNEHIYHHLPQIKRLLKR